MSEPLQKIIANRYGGRDLPVILVLPDGGRVPLSSSTETEVIVRTWRALKALASPELGRLARAYVRNEIDFTGGARRILGITEAMVGSVAHGRESLRARWRMFRHQHRSNRKNIQHHYDVSDAFYRLWLDPRMVYSCAYFSAEGDSLADAQAKKLDHICRKLRLAPGETFLDIGCGWGGAHLLGGAELRREGDGHHAFAAPVRPCDARDRRARARRTRAGEAPGLPGPARRRALRQDREHRDVRARRPAPLRQVFRQDLPRAEARRASC